MPVLVQIYMLNFTKEEITKEAVAVYNAYLLKLLDQKAEERIQVRGIRSDVAREQHNVGYIVSMLEGGKVELPTRLYGPILLRALGYYGQLIASEKNSIASKLPERIFFLDQDRELKAVEAQHRAILTELQSSASNYDPSMQGKRYGVDALP